MYDQFYGLQGRPFQLTPDPHYYFESATHRKALSYLGYGLAQGEGFIVITGDIGAGKTTLVGHLMQTIDPSRLTAVKIVSTQVEGDDMLRLAAQSFGLETEGFTKAATLQRIESFLHTQARAGRRSLLIVDEGQNLSISAIEELRMLSNFQLGGQSLLQIFLLGQPEFRDLLKSPELEQLRQRVIATHHLEPMMSREVEPYILHRLGVAGWTGNPHFTDGAFAALYAATGGVPRRLNALVSRVLLLGAIEGLHVIDADVVAAVVADMGMDVDLTPEPVEPSVLDIVEEAAEPERAKPVESLEVAEPEEAEPQPDEVAEIEGMEANLVEDAADQEPLVDASEFDRDEEEALDLDEPDYMPRILSAARFTNPYESVAEVDDERVVRLAPFASPFVQSVADHAFAEPPAEEEPAATDTPERDELATAEQVVAEEEIEPVGVFDADIDPVEEAEPAETLDALRRDMQEEIAALRAEIASLRAVQAHAPFGAPVPTVDPDALKDCFTLVEERLSTLEFRAEEQDAALRRVLTMLVEWVEREDRMADAEQDAALARAH
ncbi:MAG TPA: XrtA/PEP-CTERM system-associated ATPase [Sphingobium sp.]|nr:XrtA/PEP-CTERM system-associated ATPase [Sphingobium sp.]HUD91711.1 XrtA/PEP-CTERM system-associated ATPase [Sphingobium sp.]